MIGKVFPPPLSTSLYPPPEAPRLSGRKIKSDLRSATCPGETGGREDRRGWREARILFPMIFLSRSAPPLLLLFAVVRVGGSRGGDGGGEGGVGDHAVGERKEGGGGGGGCKKRHEGPCQVCSQEF